LPLQYLFISSYMMRSTEWLYSKRKLRSTRLSSSRRLKMSSTSHGRVLVSESAWLTRRMPDVIIVQNRDGQDVEPRASGQLVRRLSADPTKPCWSWVCVALCDYKVAKSGLSSIGQETPLSVQNTSIKLIPTGETTRCFTNRSMMIWIFDC